MCHQRKGWINYGGGTFNWFIDCWLCRDFYFLCGKIDRSSSRFASLSSVWSWGTHIGQERNEFLSTERRFMRIALVYSPFIYFVCNFNYPINVCVVCFFPFFSFYYKVNGFIVRPESEKLNLTRSAHQLNYILYKLFTTFSRSLNLSHLSYDDALCA